MKQRGKNLDDEAIAGIVGVLDGWSGKLTWGLFLASIARNKLGSYTRQALHGHTRIAEAFQQRKAALASAAGSRPRKTSDSPEVEAALQRIARLETEMARLSAENHRLLDQFVRWAYNAYTRGLDKNFLDQPLPGVNRDRTKALLGRGRSGQ